MIDKDDIKVDDEAQLLFWIPDENMGVLKEKLAKLSKKSEKAGYPPVFMMPIGFKDERGPNNYVHRVWEVLISGITPKIEGWEFWARIDYSRDSGNLIYAAPGKTIPEEYKTIDSVCEHCNRKRLRRTGYLLKNPETNEFKVVGSTCISEFFGGVTPESIAKYFETIRKTIKYASEHSFSKTGLVNYRSILLIQFISAVLESIEQWGWYSSTKAKQDGNSHLSTASRAHSIYCGMHPASPLKNPDEINKIVNWAKNLTDEEIKGNNFLNNIRVIARDGIASYNDENMIAGMVRAYQNTIQPPPARLDFSNSKPMGTIGDKLEIPVTVLSSFRSADGSFDVIKFYDSNFNLYTWFNHGKGSIKKGDFIKIKGTVRAHNTYKGVNETVLTRVKIV